MNFLMLRSNNQTAAQEQLSVKETAAGPNYASKKANTLEGLISGDPFPQSRSSDARNEENGKFGDENGDETSSNGNINSEVDSHIDVTEADGWIIIPSREIPDKWIEAPDIISLRPLDRSFVFPGEQVQVLACLSAYKQDTAIMSKNCIGQSSPERNENLDAEEKLDFKVVFASTGGQDVQNGERVMKEEIDSTNNVSAGESLLKMEDHRRQTEQVLQRFKISHFFARVAESNEPLWSKRRAQGASFGSSKTLEENLNGDPSEIAYPVKHKKSISAMIDKEQFDARTSGGVSRGAVRCCSLSNGDLVVLLLVHVGVEFVRNPILEILQFDKYQERFVNQLISSLPDDPYNELLKWLLPLDNSIPPSVRPKSPPMLSSSSSIKHTVSGSSGSQIFSFGHFRSYSMSSLPPNVTPPQTVTTSNTKPSFDPEGWDQFSFGKLVASGTSGKELLSFRGVPLEPERFSGCGLEGIFTPGRRWRKKIELIQPVEINSFSVDCNTDDLLCVRVKNVCPAHAPDIVVFIDAINIIFEEASKGEPPLFLPIASIEAGSNHTLPNIALRRGEEHSFILKPATTLWKRPQFKKNDIKSRPPRLPTGRGAAPRRSSIEVKSNGPSQDQYAVLVSCRCNYTESKLFFKQSTSWRPRISRDLSISVASEMSDQDFGSHGTQLPVQVLTLQASNLTSDDLTLTVLAPASFTSPSIVSLSNSPSSPFSSFARSAELVNSVRQGAVVLGRREEDSVIPNSDLGCTHLWLQSRIPLGSIPSQSTATIRLEVLPLTDGIISLDTLQIVVKQKGLTYVPEHSLKIYATSSIATGII